MGLHMPTYPVLKKYVEDTAEEFGAVKGAPCTVESHTHDATNHVTNVVLKWENSQGAVQRTTVPIPDGVGIASIAKTSTSGLVDTYTITFTDNSTTTFTITNGADGEGVPQGGSKGQVLTKKSGTDFDTEWKDAEGDVPIATTQVAGKVKPDGTTIKVRPDGTIYSVGGGGGGSSTQKEITASITVGGIDKDTTFPVGTDYDDLWDALLDKTLYPTFVAPSASLTYTADTYYKVGTETSATSATLGYDAGAIMLDGTKQNNRGGLPTEFAVTTTGADTEYSDTSESSGTFDVPALTRSTKGTIKITGTVSYAEGAQPLDSKGNDYGSPLSAGSVTAEKTMTFILPFYYGVSNTDTVADFTGFTASVTPKGNKSFSFTTNNQHMVVAYDSAYGNLKSILDPNGFEVISGWTKSTLTVDGFSYFVYVANSKTTDTNATFTFKF